jgi:hypothetical protein
MLTGRHFIVIAHAIRTNRIETANHVKVLAELHTILSAIKHSRAPEVGLEKEDIKG